DMRRNGYHIYSTIDKELYDTFQDVAHNYEHYGPAWSGTIRLNGENVDIEDMRVQTAAMLIENSTGKILSFVGGREYHTENDEDQNNYATSTLRSNGSTMKPLLAYGPAMELGKVQPGTPIPDLDIGDYDYIPSNYGK